ncbi:MAG: branched-chain amino acid ABC transporter permease [Planctomycetes bacterium]|nr:branched-chain amino acid ABC transporter permease [Planctomycetota bacterium]
MTPARTGERPRDPHAPFHRAGLAALVLFPAADHLLDLRLVGDVVPVLLFAILAVGLNATVGLGGLLQLGYAAYFAAGAYAAGILTSVAYPFQLPLEVATAAAVGAGALLGALSALPVLRLKGDYLAIVTLGIGEIVPVTLRNLEPITKGEFGISPVDLPGPRAWEDWTNTTHGVLWYYLALALLGLVVYCQRRLERSRIGRAWEAFREDELAASACGVDTAAVRVQLLAYSGAVAGLAGAVSASYVPAILPSQYEFPISAMVLSLVVLGGLGNWRGAVWGAILLVSLDRILAPSLTRWAQSLVGSGSYSFFLEFSNYRFLLFGLALVLVMRWRPGGLFPPRAAQERVG